LWHDWCSIYSMKDKRVEMFGTIVFMIASLLSLQSLATVGCVANGTLYPNKVGTYNGANAYSSSGGITIDPAACPRATILGSTGGTCAVLTSIWSPEIGYERNYTLVTSCPIDDYVPLLIVIGAGIGVYTLRRRIVY
jgi:hypothetical protein